MKKLISAILAGALFAIGLTLGGMTNPANVIGFLDVGGAWNPTLAFVMAGAILVHAPIVQLLAKRRQAAGLRPDPANRAIDARLIGGAALFGVGWGLSGYCPGPALASIATGLGPLVFVAAMAVGAAVTHRAD